MTKLEQIIKAALGEVGYHEGANNDNKYGEAYGFNNVAWCVEFCWWLCKRTGIDIEFPNTAHCNQVRAYAMENNKWVTYDYRVGDFIIFNYDGDWELDHIGIVVGVNSDGTLNTVEGNYSDSVCAVKRKISDGIVGAYRPDYGELDVSESGTFAEEVDKFDEEKIFAEYGSTNHYVFIVQAMLTDLGYDCGGNDGIDGKITTSMVKNFQFDNGLEKDGIVGKNTFRAIISAFAYKYNIARWEELLET